jgi:hypothetical protein
MTDSPDREARERSRYLDATTDLAEREALTIAYSELGYSDSGIATRTGFAEGSVSRYRQRAAIRYGREAIEPKPRDERGQADLAAVSKDEVMAYPRRTRKWWLDVASKHPDIAPAWALDDEEGEESR